MPSPVGHTLAGVAVALAAERLPLRLARQLPSFPRLVILTVALAVAADLDLLARPLGFGYAHRMATHSLVCVAVMTIVATAVTGWVTGRVAWGLALAVSAAHGSHLLLDWLAEDPHVPQGIQLLWPFSRAWFISGWDIFLRTERDEAFTAYGVAINTRAALRELVVVGPIVLALIWTRWRLKRA